MNFYMFTYTTCLHYILHKWISMSLSTCKNVCLCLHMNKTQFLYVCVNATLFMCMYEQYYGIEYVM